MKPISLLVLLLSFAWGLPAARFTTVTIHQRIFRTEIAETPEQQIRGLMFRTSIPDDFAMLFPYTEEDTRSFWMKNTLVPLDIIYLDRNKTVVDLYADVPPCRREPCPDYPSRKPAQYVLEIRGGLARVIGLKVGDRVVFGIDV